MVRRGSTVRVRQRALDKALQMGISCCLRWRDLDLSRVRDGYIFGLAGTCGHARRLATRAHGVVGRPVAITWSESPCKEHFLLPELARSRVPPSLERGSWRPYGFASGPGGDVVAMTHCPVGRAHDTKPSPTLGPLSMSISKGARNEDRIGGSKLPHVREAAPASLTHWDRIDDSLLTNLVVEPSSVVRGPSPRPRQASSTHQWPTPTRTLGHQAPRAPRQRTRPVPQPPMDELA